MELLLPSRGAGLALLPVPGASFLCSPLQYVETSPHGCVISCHVLSSQGHSFSLAHFRTRKCPFEAAQRHVLSSQGHPISLARWRTRRCPCFAVSSHLILSGRNQNYRISLYRWVRKRHAEGIKTPATFQWKPFIWGARITRRVRWKAA